MTVLGAQHIAHSLELLDALEDEPPEQPPAERGRQQQRPARAEALLQKRIARENARNFIVLGDPAVRIRVEDLR
jgi:hypothetical protein